VSFVFSIADKELSFFFSSKIHILGSYQNIQNARTSICNLILGSPPSKVYGKLRTVAARTAESF